MLAVQHSYGDTLQFADWHARCCSRLASAQSNFEVSFDLDQEVSVAEAAIRTWLMEGLALNAATSADDVGLIA